MDAQSMKLNVWRRGFSALGLALALLWAAAVGFGASPALNFQTAEAQVGGAVPGHVHGTTSDSDIWRMIRRGQTFDLSGTGMGTPVLIQARGEQWRAIRNGPLSYWGGILILFSTAAIATFFAVRGRVKLKDGRSGRVVPRFTQAERWIHWFVASLFIMLGASGLLIMFGRYTIKALVGAQAWSVFASAALQAHNLLGPIFIIALVILLVNFFKDNVYQRGDFSWALKGGIFLGQHAPSWKYNLGEKTWYWLMFFAGLAISASGLFLDFPTLAGAVVQLQIAQLIHAGMAVILVAASLGHIYLGTLGVEGALEGMTKGYVDENWAIEHHEWWAKEVMAQQDTPVEGAPQAIGAPKSASAH
ncbi:formate dehydrogenase gamma subunit [Varunaivibrio sulfuroxidans]|uniref:Formate dehydrogenase gamma subunit n=2 Tax=Varunaivibrio sulfuroxidans TaxID=1773489 RepID=A0A4R3JCH0_9PROT|nr:formate dehydrogenase gamma subunit [Varunaivibrio sulfuroxidans]